MGDLNWITFTPPVNGYALVIASGYCDFILTTTEFITYEIFLSETSQAGSTNFVFVSAPQGTGQNYDSTWTIQGVFPVTGGVEKTIYLTVVGAQGPYAGRGCHSLISAFFSATTLPVVP